MKRIVILAVVMATVLGVVGVASAEIGGKLPPMLSPYSAVRPQEVGGRLPTM